MKTLLLPAAVAALGTLDGCIGVERETPDTVSVERTTVIHEQTRPFLRQASIRA